MKSMRFLMYGLLLMLGSGAVAQTIIPLKPNEVRLEENEKCDANTKSTILKLKRQNSTQEVRMLAKVTARFDAAKLQSQGIVVGSKAGQIVTLRLTLDKIRVLDTYSEVLQYNIARSMAPTLNLVRFDTRTDSVHSGEGLPQAYNGEGVLVGITDWGFDFKHPNYNNNGEDNRRLLRVWDQYKVVGPAPEGFDYGREFDNRHDILQAKCDTSNIYGHHTHGTHVAGIAAGRGVDGEYMGQAPFANLLFSAFLLDEASWIDAANWMKNVSKIEDKRLVINSSWGMYTFSTLDGTSLLSQAINSLSDSGVVFVASAGNNGDVNFHISKTFNDDTLKTVPYNKVTYNDQAGNALILWGTPRSPFEATIELASADTVLTIPWYSTADGDQFIDSIFVVDNDTLHFDLTVERRNPQNGRPHMLFNVDCIGSRDLRLKVTAHNGTVHGWNVCNLTNHAGNMGIKFESKGLDGYTGGDPAYGISEPSCAESAISVAAHMSDHIDLMSGEYLSGIAADFSSEGPIIDGRHKPDISAPGMNVVSSLNSQVDPENRVNASFNYSYAGTTYSWGRMSGTSMSGPAVTGIVALILQANPNLTPANVRDIICRTARNDNMTGALIANDSISNKWGWGKIDALKAVNAALSFVSVEDIDEQWMEKSLQVWPNPATTQVTIGTGRNECVPLQIWDMNGRLVYQNDVTLETTIDISRWAKGIYVVRCGGRTSKLVK